MNYMVMVGLLVVLLHLCKTDATVKEEIWKGLNIILKDETVKDKLFTVPSDYTSCHCLKHFIQELNMTMLKHSLNDTLVNLKENAEHLCKHHPDEACLSHHQQFKLKNAVKYYLKMLKHIG